MTTTCILPSQAGSAVKGVVEHQRIGPEAASRRTAFLDLTCSPENDPRVISAHRALDCIFYRVTIGPGLLVPWHDHQGCSRALP